MQHYLRQRVDHSHIHANRQTDLYTRAHPKRTSGKTHTHKHTRTHERSAKEKLAQQKINKSN